VGRGFSRGESELTRPDRRIKAAAGAGWSTNGIEPHARSQGCQTASSLQLSGRIYYYSTKDSLFTFLAVKLELIDRLAVKVDN
jgi:hypothetical protein